MRDLLWIVVILLLAIPGGYDIISLRNTNRGLREQLQKADAHIQKLKEEIDWKKKDVNMKDEEIRLAKREASTKISLLEEQLKNAAAEFKERQDSIRKDYERRLDELRAAHRNELNWLNERNDEARNISAKKEIVPLVKMVKENRERKCPCCLGRGVVEVEKTCDVCDGKGFTVEIFDRFRRNGRFGIGYYVSPYKSSRIEHCCPVCKNKNSLDRRGSGIVKVMETCPRCLGKGVL